GKPEGSAERSASRPPATQGTAPGARDDAHRAWAPVLSYGGRAQPVQAFAVEAAEASVRGRVSSRALFDSGESSPFDRRGHGEGANERGRSRSAPPGRERARHFVRASPEPSPSAQRQGVGRSPLSASPREPDGRAQHVALRAPE